MTSQNRSWDLVDAADDGVYTLRLQARDEHVDLLIPESQSSQIIEFFLSSLKVERQLAKKREVAETLERMLAETTYSTLQLVNVVKQSFIEAVNEIVPEKAKRESDPVTDFKKDDVPSDKNDDAEDVLHFDVLNLDERSREKMYEQLKYTMYARPGRYKRQPNDRSS